MSNEIKIVLLGDSIRMNYGELTVKKLGEGYSVWQPEDNCRFVKYTQRGVFYDWREHNTNDRIMEYNRSAAAAMQEIGVPINDLWTPVYADLEGCIRADDLIHLTDKGIDVCSDLVAGIIARTAATL